MYKVTIQRKNSYTSIELRYESRTDAFLTIENVLAGDLDTEYECIVEVVSEDTSNVLD